jgi:hypothetical protein
LHKLLPILLKSELTRVNSTNVQDEGLRMPGLQVVPSCRRRGWRIDMPNSITTPAVDRDLAMAQRSTSTQSGRDTPAATKSAVST